MAPRLILASSSEYRALLLRQIGYIPDEIYHPDLDETPLKKEFPKMLAIRLAKEKAKKVSELFPNDIVLAADTVACKGRLSLSKVLDEEYALFCIKKLSGSRHRIYTGVCGILGERAIVKIAETRVKFKVISDGEIKAFIKSKQWYGKAGGYGIQGFAACFVKWIGGAEASNVCGLPLHSTNLILNSLGLYPKPEMLLQY